MNVTSRIILTIALAYCIFSQGGNIVLQGIKENENYHLHVLASIIIACMATAALIGIAMSGPRQ